MKDNENYFTTSEIKNLNKYHEVLQHLIWKVESELKNNNLDSVMIKLINEHNKKN
jgi:hypothetical protein